MGRLLRKEPFALSGNEMGAEDLGWPVTSLVLGGVQGLLTQEQWAEVAPSGKGSRSLGPDGLWEEANDRQS